jgi:hypothetical protein
MREKFSYTFKTYFFLMKLILVFTCFGCVESEITESVSAVTAGTLSGVLLDVETNNPIANKWVCLADGTTCTQTNGNGEYSFSNVSFGSNTIRAHDADGGAVDTDYQPYTFNFSSSDAGSVNILTGDPEVLDSSYAIVTSWPHNVSTSIDIDSHLVVPLSNSDCDSPNSSTNANFYFEHESNGYTILDFKTKSTFTKGSAPFAKLDLDNTGNSGDSDTIHRETVTVKLDSSGTGGKCGGGYHFYIYNYSHGSSGTETGSFSDIGVTVKVLKDGNLIKTFTPGDSATKNVWNIFTIEANGSLTTENEFVDDCRTVIPEIDTIAKCKKIID